MSTPELFSPVAERKLTGAGMKRGQSKQDYETPDDFMAAIGQRFGALFCDLAATEENKKCDRFISPEMDSLQQDWTRLHLPDAASTLWLNPEFSNIAPWAAKCALSAPVGGNLQILFLTPASIGANWFRDHVYGRALVIGLNGRLKFKGQEDYYPKDCMLSVFGVPPDFTVWNWKA